jgi:hypothetical protein
MFWNAASNLSWLKLVRTLSGNQGARGRYDTNCVDEERLTCAFAILSLTLAVQPGVGTIHPPGRIMQICPRQPGESAGQRPARSLTAGS